ncbi:MAG: hypothetical protein ACPGO5_04695 [Patescibacteria group bacterium]
MTRQEAQQKIKALVEQYERELEGYRKDILEILSKKNAAQDATKLDDIRKQLDRS